MMSFDKFVRNLVFVFTTLFGLKYIATRFKCTYNSCYLLLMLSVVGTKNKKRSYNILLTTQKNVLFVFPNLVFSAICVLNNFLGTGLIICIINIVII